MPQRATATGLAIRSENRTPSVSTLSLKLAASQRWPAQTRQKRCCQRRLAGKNLRFQSGGDIPSWGECFWPSGSRGGTAPLRDSPVRPGLRDLATDAALTVVA